MGTQQILLIVLSVIIVGAAVAVGIQMFNAQSVNSTRTAIMSDLNNMAAMVLAYYKTPVSLGGAGKVAGNVDADDVTAYLGDMLSNDNATYTVTNAAGVVTITADAVDTAITDVPYVVITGATDTVEGHMTGGTLPE